MTLWDFIAESNRIDGGGRVEQFAYVAYEKFLGDAKLTTKGVETLARELSPGNPVQLRTSPEQYAAIYGIGGREGGPGIAALFEDIIRRPLWGPAQRHNAVVELQPFTDLNGQVARAIWLHQMGGPAWVQGSFLETYYRQTMMFHSYRA